MIGGALFIAFTVYMWKRSLVVRVMLTLFALWVASFVIYFIVAFIAES